MEKNSSRTANTVRNVLYGYVSTAVTMVMQFVSRTVFIQTIGVYYLGINGLFTSVLGILSLTELGIGSAINFSLYKPVAEKDYEKIKALMGLYKKAYRVIAVVVTAIGLALIPFLPYLVNDAENIPNVKIYYLVFLFNTVSTYFVSYKYGLVNAEQKNYIINNFNSVSTFFITIVQIIVLVLTKNYMVYLLVYAGLQVCQKIGIGIYINRKYPYLKDKNITSLEKEETNKIKKNVFALMVHKIGEISVYQTDNIIISSFISVVLVGKISNYNLVITSVSTFIMIVFNSFTSSVGNLIASESKERQLEVFEIYNFLGFWLYGFAAVCYFILFQPFVTLWIGEENLIDEVSLALIILSQYLTGQRLTVNNMKTAGGIFEQDKFVSLLQGGVNLVVSIICVKLWGLPGVYVGTVVSGLCANIIRPIIVYKKLFDKNSVGYFIKFTKYLLVTVAVCAGLRIGLNPLITDVSILRFILLTIICVVVSNGIFALCFCRSKEFKGMLSRAKTLVASYVKKK